MTLIASQLNVEIEGSLGTETAITAITNANPAVVTSATHGLTDGDWVYIRTQDGMPELNWQLARIANSSADTFELEGIDSTNYGTFVSGTFTAVLSWLTLCQSTNIDIGNATPTELDGTTLCSRKAITLYGLPGSISGTIDIQHDPHAAAVQYLKAASTSTGIAFRVTWQDGSISGFVGQSAYSGGFSAAVQQIVTGQIPVTVPGDIVEYPAP